MGRTGQTGQSKLGLLQSTTEEGLREGGWCSQNTACSITTLILSLLNVSVAFTVRKPVCNHSVAVLQTICN